MRIAAGPAEVREREALAISYVDLRYDDRRVERWLARGAIDTVRLDDFGAVVAWASETVEWFADDMLFELGRTFSRVTRHVLDVAVEVVFEWNADPVPWRA